MDIKKEVKELCDKREGLAMAIQKDIVALAMKYQKFKGLEHEIYLKLNKPDCLYNDSPISPFKTNLAIRQYMIKKDLDFVGYVLDGKQSVVDLSEHAKACTGWIMRFATEPEKVKTGIDAILDKEVSNG